MSSQRETLLVVGASSDIGVALLGRCLAANPELQIVAHQNTGSERLKELVAASSGRVDLVTANFESLESVAQMAKDVVAKHGVPSQLVYLPGLKLRYERFSKFDMTHFDRDLSIQLRSAVVLLKDLAPKMSKLERGAKIVFVLSSVTRDSAPPKFMSMYTVVKYAQLGLMRSLAAEYAATKLNINAVSPSMVQTRFLDDIPEVAKEMAAAANPRGRLASPSDVAAAIELLLSPNADGVTGSELPVMAS